MRLKQTIFSLLGVGLLISCSGDNAVKKDGFSSITGTYDTPYSDQINLYKVAHGKSFEVATAKVNEKKEFGFKVSPDKEGFYILGDERNVKIPLYIKGNQAFELQYNPEGYTLKGIPDTENQILYDWVQQTDTLEIFGFNPAANKTYKDFFPFYEKFIPTMKAYHEKVVTENPRFNELMHAYIDLKIEHVAMYFIYTPHSIHPKKEDMPSFYDDFMKGKNFETAMALDLPHGIDVLRMHKMYEGSHNVKDIPREEMTKWMVQSVENDTLRGHFALEYLRTFRAYGEDYLAYIEPLRKDVALSDYATETLETYEVSIKTMAPGQQGYPFTYADQNGKEVSFEDFRGKYVYIDAWATWCAPCKAQIPYLKKLEKEFHGKDIEFVSISMDKPKDHEKWKKFIEKEELGGVQLFSDDAFNTRIAKDYKINAIPRFLLFDKEGKIVDANAKRPSDPALQKQLQSLLN